MKLDYPTSANREVPSWGKPQDPTSIIFTKVCLAKTNSRRVYDSECKRRIYLLPPTLVRLKTLPLGVGPDVQVFCAAEGVPWSHFTTAVRSARSSGRTRPHLGCGLALRSATRPASNGSAVTQTAAPARQQQLGAVLAHGLRPARRTRNTPRGTPHIAASKQFHGKIRQRGVMPR